MKALKISVETLQLMCEGNSRALECHERTREREKENIGEAFLYIFSLLSTLKRSSFVFTFALMTSSVQ